jgi:hypothetical protein
MFKIFYHVIVRSSQTLISMFFYSLTGERRPRPTRPKLRMSDSVFLLPPHLSKIPKMRPEMTNILIPEIKPEK